jgi:23S rRNA (cytosine1962-C5)-methyltransferase
MPSVTLKPGREKSVARRHPWIFSGALERVDGDPAPGDTVEVLSAEGQVLARGAYSPQSQIAVRIWTFDLAQPINGDWFRLRLTTALAARAAQAIASSETDCLRLVNAESDGLPGLVVDRYADYLVCQFLSAGAERWKPDLVQLLGDLLPVRGIYERSDVDVRQKEGLAPVTGVLSGDAPPEVVAVTENGVRFLVDVRRGHKTGFYLDQRDNRARIGQQAAGREVLNCFAYSGGFGVFAQRGQAARVTHVDTSAPALELARRNSELNQLPADRSEFITADVFEFLRRCRDARREFDLIVLDPPKFAESRSQVEQAARGYKDINLLALKLLRPGGLLFTFSCSGLVTPDLFQKIVAGAALDAGRAVQIVGRMTQAADHPVALNFPEGEYLKGLLCRVE